MKKQSFSPRIILEYIEYAPVPTVGAWRSYHRVQENRVMDKFRSKQIVKTFLSQFKRFSLDYLEKNHVDLVVLNTEDYFDQFSWMIETLVLTVIPDASDWK